MKLVSKFALALSFAAVTAAPAFAQSNEKPKKEKKGRKPRLLLPRKIIPSRSSRLTCPSPIF
jgi:hypothetical protein